MLEALVEFAKYYTQLLAIMNPFSALPTFVALTEGLDDRERRAVVLKAFWAMLALVLAFATVGSLILEAFSISIASLRIGGGIILMVLAVDMLGEMPRTKAMDPRDIAVVPIATPLIIGPGTMTTILLLTSSNPTPAGVALILAAGVAAVATTTLILLEAWRLVSILRVSTVRALGRFMALIIAGVAVDMIARGVYDYVSQFYGPRAP